MDCEVPVPCTPIVFRPQASPDSLEHPFLSEEVLVCFVFKLEIFFWKKIFFGNLQVLHMLVYR